MDRKTRERCAGTLAVLCVVMTVGCGADQTNSDVAARKVPSSQARAADAQATRPTTAPPQADPQGTVVELVDVVHVPPVADGSEPLRDPYETSDAALGAAVTGSPAAVAPVEAMASPSVEEIAPEAEALEVATNEVSAAAITEWSELDNSPYAVDNGPDSVIEFVPDRDLTPQGDVAAKGAHNRAELKFSIGGGGEVAAQTFPAQKPAAAAPTAERPRLEPIKVAVRPHDAAVPQAVEAAPQAAPQAAPAESEVADVNADESEVPQVAEVPPAEAATPGAADVAEAKSAGEPADEAAAPQDEAVAKSELMPLVVQPREAPQAEPPAVARMDVPRHSHLQPQLQAQPARPAVMTPQASPPVAQPAAVAHSPATLAALARAHERVRHGVQLAQKGALYASRKEFTTAIKMIALANDAEQRTRQYSRAAIAGFVALKEANDFVGQNATLTELDVARVALGHKTPVLKDLDLIDMPPSIAAQYYYGYAKDQLADAIGRDTTGSIAMYGLGKIIIAGAGPNGQQLEYTGPAMALYQAAMIAEPQNFRAAHELGVLLAGSGQLEMAREMLIASARQAPQPVVWRNLATVHSRMGEQQLAQQAQQRAAALQATNPESNVPQVQWVDPATFSKTVPATDSMVPQAAPAAPPIAAATTHAEPTMPKGKVAKKRLDEWAPLNLRR